MSIVQITVHPEQQPEVARKLLAAADDVRAVRTTMTGFLVPEAVAAAAGLGVTLPEPAPAPAVEPEPEAAAEPAAERPAAKRTRAAAATEAG